MIAFRGQNRSEAQYVVSNSPGRTDGTGIVQQVRRSASWKEHVATAWHSWGTSQQSFAGAPLSWPH